VGGGQMLPATLTEVIQAHGGVVRTRCQVRRILVVGGHAEGVELADGTTARAPVVVSNADYRQTILELCDKDAFPDAVRERTRQAAMRAAVATLYVGVDRPIDVPNANLWWWREADIEDSYIAALSGAGPLPFAFLSFTSVKDRGNPATCPPGHANFQVMTLIPPLTGVSPGYRREAGYQSAKQRMSDELVDIAEQLIGPFRSRITHLETATAHTNHRFTLGGCGTPYGLAEWGGVSRRPDVRTSVDGLYVVGKNTRYGSGVAATAIGGVTAASRILGRPLLPSVHAGTVLGDPGLLRDRDSAFDPLQTSRGQYRRG
jgi:phytoene dehydrogenase-like protein